MTNVPLQGPAGGVVNAANPTLLPNFDQAIASGGGTVDFVNPYTYLAANPRVDAQATASFTGSVTTSDKITLVVYNPIFMNSRLGPFSPPQISHTYTTLAGDSLTNIAENLADAFNDDANAQQVGLRVDVAKAVMTFRWNGPVGNSAVLSSVTEQPSTITVGGTALTGDALNLLFTGAALAVVANATETATIGGTVATGNATALIFTNSGVSGLPVTKTYTALAGDSTTAIAAGLVALINADAVLIAAGFYAWNDGAVITVEQPGAIGNNTVLTDTVQGSVTVTFGNGGDLSGGKGAPGQTTVLVTSATTTSQSATTMAHNLSLAIDANPVLAALSITSTDSSGKITMSVPAATEPLSITGWVNTITPTATITGTVAAGDILNVTVTSPAIAGGSASVSYTAITGDNTTKLATGIKNAINASAALIAAGITATSSTNVVTFLYQGAGGQIRFGSSVSPGSETITFTTAPTETLFFSTTTTEVVTVGNGATPVVAASVVATVTGTGVAADTIALTFTNAGVTGWPETVTYTCVSTDSATTVAAGLVALIMADAVLQAAGVIASNSSGVITITQPGTLGNSTVMSVTLGGGNTGTTAVTFTPSNGHLGGGSGVVGGVFSGGSGPVIPFNNFMYSASGVICNLRAGQPEYVDPVLLASLVSEGNPIV